MFTGLVEMLGTIVAVVPEPPGARLVVRAEPIARATKLGASIAVNGCCLTVVAIDPAAGTFAFQAGPETLARTNLGPLAAGSVVNLERSLQLGSELGGHLVTGHIDCTGELLSRDAAGDWVTLWFAIPPRWARQLAAKGSIAVDGVSLTLVDVEPDRFSVALIPHTLAITTLGQLAVGQRVNLETDLLAKYVERQLSYRD